jgi:hypothetical protein
MPLKDPEKRKEYEKQWRKDHAKEHREQRRKYHIKNANKEKQWRKDHADEKREHDKKYRKDNAEKIRQWRTQYQRHRRHSDPEYKLTDYLRIRFRKALNGNWKAGSAVRDLGCSIHEFKKYLESKFQPGMTWGNNNRYGWHLDHIIPLAKFNLQNRDQLLIALNYTNYQPLWAKDNLTKSDFHVLDYREGMF